MKALPLDYFVLTISPTPEIHFGWLFTKYQTVHQIEIVLLFYVLIVSLRQVDNNIIYLVEFTF